MTFENPSDIVEFILEVATAGIKSSAIISRTSLSSVDLTEYLHVLLVHDLIAYRQIDKKYLTTTKGMSYLETYNDIRSQTDRKSTRLNSSHPSISYAVFCLKKKKNIKQIYR